MTRQFKDLFETDWEKELEEDEIITRHENGETLEVVPLAALQRLARKAGIIGQRCQILTPSQSMVQAIFTSVFRLFDEAREEYISVEFVGTGDCNKNNTQGVFSNYPTSVAESRAEARSLRKALGIRILSSEEVGFREGVGSLEASPSAKASGSLIAAIEKLCETRGVDAVAALNAVLEDERASQIYELSELKTNEAQAVMTWLNEQKPKAASKSKRSARKAELEAKQGE